MNVCVGITRIQGVVSIQCGTADDLARFFHARFTERAGVIFRTVDGLHAGENNRTTYSIPADRVHVRNMFIQMNNR